MSSIPVPLKTRRVGQRCTLNLSRAETSSRWCGVVVREGVPAQVSSTSLDHGSKLRGPSPKALVAEHCQVIYSQFGLAIHQNDHQARRRFVEWDQNEIAVVPDFHKRILFSDEAHFWLNGYVKNKTAAFGVKLIHTCMSKHHFIRKTAFYRLVESFFKNDEGYNVTVNGDRYRAMITNFFILELNNYDVQELWFQQDDTTCHTARATIDLLKDTFGDRLISRFGPVNWPPRSCDLTPLDYFLWSYVKSLVYADNHKRLTIWKTIFAVLLPIYSHKCWKKSSKIGRPDWTTSEPAVAVKCQKSYLKCVDNIDSVESVKFISNFFLSLLLEDTYEIREIDEQKHTIQPQKNIDFIINEYPSIGQKGFSAFYSRRESISCESPTSFPEDTSMPYSGFEPEPTRLQVS
ncbi:uncharacterized protein TNCV_955041 [Trichonephila clavipes]|nr:uncharacterized protein TNCV_955041 [Trichonephila clavipes]